MQNLAIIPLLFSLLTSAVPTAQPSGHILASKQISLEARYNNKFVNDVFKDNILLNIAYLEGKPVDPKNVDWKEVEKPFTYEFKLPQGKTFAYHDGVLPKYKDSIVLTTKAHFNAQEGFKSDGYLTGDGVCHLASLIYWAAKSANLDSYAPTNHDFAQIPEISREYGVSIYNAPGDSNSNAMQNLYITNNFQNPIIFKFEYDGKNLKVSIVEEKQSAAS